MVQQLRRHPSSSGTWVQSLVRELRSHMPHGVAKKLKKKKKSCPCADGLCEREEHRNQGINKNIEMVSRDPRSGEQGVPQGGGGKRETQKVQCTGAAGSLCPQNQPGGQWTGGGSGR